MIPSLPKLKRDPELVKDLCKCFPYCKSRRHELKGKILDTSAELLLDRKPPPDCILRLPRRVYPNHPCPLLNRTKRVTEDVKYLDRKPHVVRICQAPIDTQVETPYLITALVAKRLGVVDNLKLKCPFCSCCKCCSCGTRCYPIKDDVSESKRRADMRQFDSRVKKECLEFRVVYR